MHLLSRLDPHADDPNHTAPALYIAGNRIYHHRVFRVNYTTYDVRRAQDSVNPRTHPHIMLLSPPSDDSDSESCAGGSTVADEHPYLYARVIDVLHVNVYPLGSPSSPPQRVDVLWVRWLALDPSAPGGPATKRYPRVEFVRDGASGDPAFGFVDPADVLRGAHLMPVFAQKRTKDLLGPSPAARVGQEYSDLRADDEDTDFRYYYVNMYVLNRCHLVLCS